jgi:tetratricopeptide (TPR) repeat protein
MGEKKRRLAAAQANQAGQTAIAPGTASVPPAHNDAGSRALAQARQFLQHGKLIEAINGYQQLLRSQPDLPALQKAEALHFQGLALSQAGQTSLGLGLLQQALAFDEGNALYHYNLALAMMDGAPAALAAALPHATRACALAPDDVGYHATLAEYLIAAGQREQAKLVLLDGPKAARLLDFLAQLHYADDQLALAGEQFAAALALQPALAKQRMIGHATPNGAACAETRIELANDVANELTNVCAEFARPARWQDQAALDAYLTRLDLHILDDCLPDPLAWREQALQLPFHAIRYAGQNYPGLQTDGQPCQRIMQLIANQLGKTIKFISPDNGSYRVSFGDSVAQSDIHVDNESGEQFASYAAVLYLNLPAQCQSGTRFWQHRATGWQRRWPETVVREAGYVSFKSFQQQCLPKNRSATAFNAMVQQRADWQAILEVPMRHNRLIMYRGDFFHSIGEVFGRDMQDGRLVQLFFFDIVE